MFRKYLMFHIPRKQCDGICLTISNELPSEEELFFCRIALSKRIDFKLKAHHVQIRMAV